MINWNIIPAVYNDSFTYMEWLGKLSYIADNHETRIDAAEKEIIDLWSKVNDHETRIGTLETWRRDTVDPFIEATTQTLADHERRIGANEEAIGALNTWKNDTVDPFITTITTWKNDTVDPFITQTTADITEIKANAVAEAAARKNADDNLSDKLNETDIVARDTQALANRLSIDIENVGTIRYFLTTPSISTVSADTVISFNLPDEDWATIDVRFGIVENNSVIEYRITGLKSETSHQTTVNGVNFTFAYNSTTNSITINVFNKTWIAADVFRFDYILYKAALTLYEQEQRDIAFFNAMDTNHDGYVDASDASNVLAFYTAISTGHIPAIYHTAQEQWNYYCTTIRTDLDPTACPDFDGDGYIDATDASQLLNFYAFASTDGSGMTGPELMKKYRTKLTNENE